MRWDSRYYCRFWIHFVFFGGSIFGVPSVILLPKMAPEKKMAPGKKTTIWAYIGEDGASRMAIWFQKKTRTSVLLSGRILGKIAPKEWAFGFRKNCQAFLSYNLGVYWGRWRPKNGHLVSGQFSGTCCPTVWADKATNGTPKMDVLWQDIFQGLLSHSLDTHGSKNGFPKRDWPNGRSNWALFWEQKT